MNILLLNPEQFIAPDRAQIRGRQLVHLLEVLKVQIGKIISVGLINAYIDQARIECITSEYVEIQLLGTAKTPPPTLPCTLVLGLPRPRMLQRSLQTIATMGVEKLLLIGSERVEKSFWQTPLLKEAAIAEQLELGLEQAKATQFPEVMLCPNWREFIKHQLPAIAASTTHKIIAHPGSTDKAAQLASGTTILCIGPEGGFVDTEVKQILELGFTQVHLGERILRVETAIPVLLAKLFE